MTLPTRIVVPVALAVLVAAGLLLYLWVQLSNAPALSTQTLSNQSGATAVTATIPDAPIDSADQALLHLRRGDLLALQGDWIDAEMEYQTSVKAGGGVPALRKLAQAQMQRRETGAVRQTINQLKRAGARSEDLLLLETLVHLRAGEFDQAQALLTPAADSPQKQYAQALLDIGRGDHDKAKAELQTVIGGWDPILRSYARTIQDAYDEYATFPDSRPIHLETLLARALAQTQECELALPILSQVIAEQDDYRDAWMVQGYCELVTERNDQALASLERAYALDPEKPEIQYFLARAHAALGDHANAITFFQYALKNGFTPENEVRKYLAAEAEKINDIPTALAQYKAMTDAPDGDIDAYQKYVALLIANGSADTAYPIAQAAVKKWPDDPVAEELLGWAASLTNRRDEAIAALQKSLKLDPTRDSAREKLKKLQ